MLLKSYHKKNKKFKTDLITSSILLLKITMLLMKKNFFDQPIKNGQRTYDNIQKNASGQGDDYTTGWLLDYPYSKEHYKVILEV